MQKCCDTSIGQPRQTLDQLFIRIEKIVTGWLDIVEIAEFEWLRERNGRAGRKNGECGVRSLTRGQRSRDRIRQWSH